ncbi:MAG: twin-arginine translocase TatA/TatE family subunit, partial [Bacteroidota bacterium]
FGPQKMPEIARKIGKVINQMKHATSELSKEFNEESQDIRKTLDDETKSIRKSFDNTKKEFTQENKNLENELSIKTDIKKRRNKTPEKQPDNHQQSIDKEKKDNQNE